MFELLSDTNTLGFLVAFCFGILMNPLLDYLEIRNSFLKSFTNSDYVLQSDLKYLKKRFIDGVLFELDTSDLNLKYRYIAFLEYLVINSQDHFVYSKYAALKLTASNIEHFFTTISEVDAKALKHLEEVLGIFVADTLQLERSFRAKTFYIKLPPVLKGDHHIRLMDYIRIANYKKTKNIDSNLSS